MKRKGFDIALHIPNFDGAETPKSVRGFLFKALPVEFLSHRPGIVDAFVCSSLFIPVSKTIGLEIENNKESINGYFFFIPSGIEKTTVKVLYNDYGMRSIEGEGHIVKHANMNISSDKVRFVLFNETSRSIYFDKTYSSSLQPSSQSKSLKR